MNIERTSGRVRKRNISSSKSRPKNEFKEQRGVETFVSPLSWLSSPTMARISN